MPLQTEGRGHATPATDGKPGSRMFEGSLELEQSLVHLLPTEMVDEVGPRSCSDGMTTASGEDNMSTEGMSQLGLSDNISGHSTLQLPKVEGYFYLHFLVFIYFLFFYKVSCSSVRGHMFRGKW